jgi:hypothetical protein
MKPNYMHAAADIWSRLQNAMLVDDSEALAAVIHNVHLDVNLGKNFNFDRWCLN